MKTPHVPSLANLARGLTATAVVALGLPVAACGGEKPTHAKTPPPSQAETTGVTNAQPPVRLPNTATASNVSISEDVLRACNIPDSDAYFRFDSSELTTFDHGPLDAVAECFTRGPMAGRKMDLVGHADPRGASDYNMTLGQSRADAVASYLDTRGMSASKTWTTSRGAMDATGRDETGWAHDRRVDIRLAK
jgi:peptidoglycan-associated lipoprotein